MVVDDNEKFFRVIKSKRELEEIVQFGDALVVHSDDEIPGPRRLLSWMTKQDGELNIVFRELGIAVYYVHARDSDVASRKDFKGLPAIIAYRDGTEVGKNFGGLAVPLLVDKVREWYR